MNVHVGVVIGSVREMSSWTPGQEVALAILQEFNNESGVGRTFGQYIRGILVAFSPEKLDISVLLQQFASSYDRNCDFSVLACTVVTVDA